MTQKEEVLEYMRTYGSIQPLEALNDLGVYRLAACIFNLRADGHAIRTEQVESRSKRTGRKVRFARYRLL